MEHPEDDVAEVARILAAGLRAGRERLGWRLDDLADRSGVSRGMIHQIETARTNPSVATLTRLSRALGVPLSELLELPPQIGRVARGQDAIMYHHDDSTAALLISDGRHELWYHQLQPGDEIKDDGHPPGSRELIHIYQGSLTVQAGPTTLVGGTGDALVFRADRRHAYRNTTEIPAHYTVMVIYERQHDDRYPIHGPGPHPADH